MPKVVIIGGGAAGLLAAGRAAECGAKVILLERNSIVGRKLRITGKGRCNVTNTAEKADFIAAFGPDGKFLYGAYSRFSNQDVIDLLERLGVPTKVERGGRVFPKSDSADDVANALAKWIKDLGVDVRPGTKVQGLAVEDACEAGESGEGCTRRVTGVKVFSGVIPADAVILATGGITYPKTGSTGDGYRMGVEVGHTVVPPAPSLTALDAKESWVPDLEGLSLKNVSAALLVNGKRVAKEQGEMLFTHFGVSGPIVLTLSKVYSSLTEYPPSVSLSINLKPGVTREQLDERLIGDFTRTVHYKNYLSELLPRMLIPVFTRLSMIPADTSINKVTAEQRKRIIDLLLDFRMTITGTRPMDEAIVTAGGVSTREIDPRTMESKLVSGLYFAGEVVDVDAVTGGFNLQAAFTMGWVAGESAAGSGK
jgi:hypothetical protein